MINSKFLCIDCLRSQKGSGFCCGKRMLCIGTKARAPKKTASKTAWKKFFQYQFKNTINPLVISKMKELGLNVLLNEAEIRKVEEAKVDDPTETPYTKLNYEDQMLIWIIINKLDYKSEDVHEHLLTKNFKSGNIVYIVRDFSSYYIPEMYHKDLEVQEVKIIINGHGIGFYQNTETKKTFRNFKSFRVFKDKIQAQVYHHIYMSAFANTTIFPYSVEKALKRNRIKISNPEYFL